MTRLNKEVVIYILKNFILVDESTGKIIEDIDLTTSYKWLLTTLKTVFENFGKPTSTLNKANVINRYNEISQEERETKQVLVKKIRRVVEDKWIPYEKFNPYHYYH
jgi:hypothetical protein